VLFRSPGYTLAPDATMTDIVAEIRAALDWLAEHGAAHGIAGPIVLSGWSAGGHLTAMCLDHPSVVAGLAISGIFELGPLRDTSLDEKLRLTDDEIATLSPLRLPVVHKKLAITYGTAELPPLGIRQSRSARCASNGAFAGGADPGGEREPLHHHARAARRGWRVDAAGYAVGMTVVATAPPRPRLRC
jgi:arylformamidase